MPILSSISKDSDKNFNMTILGVFLRISYQSLFIEFPDYREDFWCSYISLQNWILRIILQDLISVFKCGLSRLFSGVSSQHFNLDFWKMFSWANLAIQMTIFRKIIEDLKTAFQEYFWGTLISLYTGIFRGFLGYSSQNSRAGF